MNAGGELVALLIDEPAEPWRLAGGLWRPADSERLAAEVLAERPTAENAENLAHQWMIAERPQVSAVRAGRRIGACAPSSKSRPACNNYACSMTTWAALTRTRCHGRADATTTLLRDGAYSEDVGRRLLVAVGELCQLVSFSSAEPMFA